MAIIGGIPHFQTYPYIYIYTHIYIYIYIYVYIYIVGGYRIAMVPSHFGAKVPGLAPFTPSPGPWGDDGDTMGTRTGYD